MRSSNNRGTHVSKNSLFFRGLANPWVKLAQRLREEFLILTGRDLVVKISVMTFTSCEQMQVNRSGFWAATFSRFSRTFNALSSSASTGLTKNIMIGDKRIFNNSTTLNAFN